MVVSISFVVVLLFSLRMYHELGWLCHAVAVLLSLEKCLFRSFAHFQNWALFHFFVNGCVTSLYILDINLFSDTLGTDIFSHCIGCLVILLTDTLKCRNF